MGGPIRPDWIRTAVMLAATQSPLIYMRYVVENYLHQRIETFVEIPSMSQATSVGASQKAQPGFVPELFTLTLVLLVCAICIKAAIAKCFGEKLIFYFYLLNNN